MSTLIRGSRSNPAAGLDGAPAARRAIYLSTYLAGMTSIQVLHLALDDLSLMLWLSLALSCGFLYSYLLGQRWRGLTTYAISAAAAGVSIYYFVQYQKDTQLVANYLGILLGLLMVLLAFKAFAPSDHRFIVMVCTIFLLFSSVASYDIKFMALLPVFLLFAGSSLYVASQVEVAVRAARSSYDPRSGAPPPALNVRLEVNGHFRRVLLRAVAGVIALSIFTYIVTPHGSVGNRNLMVNTAPRVSNGGDDLDDGEDGAQPSQPSQSGDATVGLGNDFDLTDTRGLTADPKPVLQMKCHRNGYLRANVYDTYTGSGWAKSAWKSPEGLNIDEISLDPIFLAAQRGGDNSNTAFSVPLLDFPSETTARTIKERIGAAVHERNTFSQDNGEQLDYEVLVQQFKLLEKQPALYFAMYAPYKLENISLTSSGSMVNEPLLDQLSCLRGNDPRRSHPAGFSFTVRSVEVRARPADLNKVISPGPATIVSHYTQLPPDNPPDAAAGPALGYPPEEYRRISPRLRNFAHSIVDDAAGGKPASLMPVGEKVAAIVDFLSDPDEFAYSRDYVRIDAKAEFCEAFVLGTKEGHCRYYASAMAVLCRLNGIPARVVSGYAPGDYSIVDNAYVYRSSNAHAWVEVYFDGYGWVTFDPTPEGTANRRETWLAKSLQAVMDFLQELFVVDPGSTQQTILQALRNLLALARQNLTVTLSSLAALVSAAALILILRRRVRRPRRIAAENEVVRAYFRAAAALARLGVSSAPSTTGRVLFARAAQSHSQLAQPAGVLLPLYERAAFSRELPAAEAVEQARQASFSIKNYADEQLKQQRRRKR